MRMTKSNATATLNAVRAISEGRAPARRLPTVPFVEYRAPLAPAPACYDDIFTPAPRNPLIQRRTPIIPYFEAYSQTQPAEFRTRDFTAYLIENGWGGKPTQVKSFLQERRRAGDIQTVRHEGKFSVWRFA